MTPPCRRSAAVLLTWLFAVSCAAAVVDRLPPGPPGQRRVALTFDACESNAPAGFDETVLACLLREKVPFTIFAGGKFAERNAARLRELAAFPFVEVENHSFAHRQHMERMSPAEVEADVRRAERVIAGLTSRPPRFFRFPGGNYDDRTLEQVEKMGYRVVHWTFASGDPDPKVTPERLEQYVLSGARDGGILIFHVNGRGWATGRALPGILAGLRERGYRFVRLDEAIEGAGPAAGSAPAAPLPLSLRPGPPSAAPLPVLGPPVPASLPSRGPSIRTGPGGPGAPETPPGPDLPTPLRRPPSRAVLAGTAALLLAALILLSVIRRKGK
ncbi:MAG: polysaccharide deacetylase family protein [Acidobacteria bacterium]|nr:polysaccharide deacetylase family protein [Acidobacteriota bacterium]